MRIEAGEHPLAPFTVRLAVDGFDVKATLIMLEQILEGIRDSARAGEGPRRGRAPRAPPRPPPEAG
jgi:hypothetical protein